MHVTIELTEEQLASLKVADSQGRETNHARIVNDPKIVAEYLAHLKDLKQEHVVLLTLNSRKHLIKRHVISNGTLDAALMHPRELFLPAIKDHASTVILAHNHPSGEYTPSEDDQIITRRMITAGKILGIALIDHVIVAKEGFYSFQEHGLIEATIGFGETNT